MKLPTQSLIPLLLLLSPSLATAACTTTLTVLPSIDNLNPTTTTYLSTLTTSLPLNCHGCTDIATTTAHLGPGPEKPSPTATLIEAVTTTTVLYCESCSCSDEGQEL
ncbi:hypothetical protein MMC12_001434 [Toensbergia leucococca]|nr:hypothetical protein [Toensbergia leucococca]